MSEAKKKFLQLQVLYPDYKETPKYLVRLDADIKLLEERLAYAEKMEKAEHGYTEALAFYGNHDFEEAKKKFLEVAGLEPNYKNVRTYLSRIDADIQEEFERQRRAEQEEKVLPFYTEAMDLYHNKKDFVMAKDMFVKVAQILPDYKKTQSYLSRIDQDIRDQNTEFDRNHLARAEVLYKQATTFLNQKKEIEAYQRLLELEAYYPDYKATRSYIENVKKFFSLKKVVLAPVGMSENPQEVSKKQAGEDAILAAYEGAVFLLKHKKTVAARAKFQDIEKARPDYRSTRKYLAEIDKAKKKREDLARIQTQYREAKRKERADQEKERNKERERQRKADLFYQQGVGFFQAKKYFSAKEKFGEALKVVPGYKDVAQYFVRIALNEVEEKKKLEELELQRKADVFYKQGVDLLSAKKYSSAREKFGEALKVVPGYKDVAQYFIRIDSAEADEKQREKDAAVQGVYQEAVSLFKNKKNQPARSLFMDVEKRKPNYQATRQYLTAINEAEKEKERQETLRQETEKKRQDLAQAEKQRLEAKRKEREDQEKKKYEQRELQRKADAFYQQGVEFFRTKKYSSAREHFGEVLKVIPGYKDVGQYIVRIDVAEAAAPIENRGVSLSEKLPKSGEYEAKISKAEPLYGQAIELYKDKRYDEAKVRFVEVTKILPKYKSTDDYLELIAKKWALKTPDELRKEAAAVQDLSTRSADLYRQIKGLANDKEMASVTKTFSKIDEVIANLENEQNRIAKEIIRQEKAAREAAAKITRDEAAGRIVNVKDAAKIAKAQDEDKIAKAQEGADGVKGSEVSAEPVKKTAQQQKLDQERQRLTEIEKKRLEIKENQEKKKKEAYELQRKSAALYEQGMEAFGRKKNSLARERFNELLKIFPGYKDVDRYLVRIDRAEGEEKILLEENVDKQEIARLAEKANAVNVDALQCSQNKDFIGLQNKFSDLAELLKEIQVVRDRMQVRRDKFASSWESRADDSKKKLAMKEKVGKMKLAAGKQQLREKARRLFSEGEMFYANGDYPEAKVKFREAALVDPGLRSATTYVERIERIISKRDYEEQKKTIKKESRVLERLQEKKEGLIANEIAGDAIQDFSRAKTVYDEGMAFYKIKRYREARIKFEEARKVGDADQRKKADRYMKLVETALEDERLKAEKAKIEGEKRYLEIKRTEDLVSSQVDSKKSYVGGISKSFDEEADDAAVQRQLEIRLIEQQNALERSKIHKEGDLVSLKALHEEKAEGIKFTKISQQENMKPLDKQDAQKEAVMPPVQEKVVAPNKVAVAKGGKAVKESRVSKTKNWKDAVRDARQAQEDVKRAASVSEEGTAGKTVINNSLRSGESSSALDVREVRRFQRMAAEQKAREDRVERQLAALARQRKIMQQEQGNASADDVARDKEAVSIDVPKKEQAASLAEVSKKEKVSTSETVIPRTSVASGNDQKAAQQEKARLLRVAADEEKRLLNQQRAAIRKDFEAGVNRLYNEAVGLFNKKLYEEAQELFLEVQELIPEYKKTNDFLRQISRKIYGQKESFTVPSPEGVSLETVSGDQHSQSVTQILDHVESSAK
ncbi:MAG: hypothetical protein HQL21_06975 [Candidatus Omnitrophica bacterium]|nr:hypothetical protein [Candidatus Omnitrophota bacterium]